MHAVPLHDAQPVATPAAQHAPRHTRPDAQALLFVHAAPTASRGRHAPLLKNEPLGHELHSPNPPQLAQFGPPLTCATAQQLTRHALLTHCVAAVQLAPAGSSGRHALL